MNGQYFLDLGIALLQRASAGMAQIIAFVTPKGMLCISALAALIGAIATWREGGTIREIKLGAIFGFVLMILPFVFLALVIGGGSQLLDS